MTTAFTDQRETGAAVLPSRRVGERSEPDRREGSTAGMVPFPDPEVSAKAHRRRFSRSYKLRIVTLADRCEQQGDTGALLRREGLYSSQLCQWRKLRDSGALNAHNGKRRGPMKQPVNPLRAELDRVRKEKVRLEKRLKQAELIIQFQKKAAEILNIPLGEFEGNS